VRPKVDLDVVTTRKYSFPCTEYIYIFLLLGVGVSDQEVAA